MADKERLRLNELSRYRKTSNRLALEVYSHCEVPAGCGGIVLRWRRPDADFGITFSCYLSAPSEGFFLDGTPLEEQRASVAPGEHVLSFVVENPGAHGFLLLHARLKPPVVSALRPDAISQANGRWRAATRQPPEGWQLPGFDDSSFVPLVMKAVPKPQNGQAWQWESLRHDAKGLGLSSAAPRAWVRWAFRLDLEGFA